MVKLVRSTGLLISAAALLSLLSLLSTQHWLFDLLANFRLQYLVTGAIALPLLLWCKSTRPALIVLAVMAVHAVDVARSQYPQRQIQANANPVLRVMSSNLLASNSAHTDVIAQINTLQPDLIVFQEYTHAWHSALSRLSGLYQHGIFKPLNSPFGIALYSKHPLRETGLLINNSVPEINALVTFNDRQIAVHGVHIKPPISSAFHSDRNQHLRQLANYTKTATTALLVLGDFNTTPWSGHFRQFVHTAKLHDARRGFGVKPTWPASILPLQIPIDHIFVNDALDVVAIDTASVEGSDHKLLWADLRLR